MQNMMCLPQSRLEGHACLRLGAKLMLSWRSAGAGIGSFLVASLLASGYLEQVFPLWPVHPGILQPGSRLQTLMHVRVSECRCRWQHVSTVGKAD